MKGCCTIDKEAENQLTRVQFTLLRRGFGSQLLSCKVAGGNASGTCAAVEQVFHSVDRLPLPGCRHAPQQ